MSKYYKKSDNILSTITIPTETFITAEVKASLVSSLDNINVLVCRAEAFLIKQKQIVDDVEKFLEELRKSAEQIRIELKLQHIC